MKALILEDEKPAARRLEQLILQVHPGTEVIDVLDSVEDSLYWLKTYAHPDIIFADIQLSDSISFDIFKKIECQSALIFTTAFDEFAIQAFKVSAVDYLLKPVDKAELRAAIDKAFSRRLNSGANIKKALEIFLEGKTKKVKERFLVKIADQLKFIPVSEVAYFFSDDGSSYIITNANHRFIIDDKLDTIESQLDDQAFFRINRKFILGIHAIKSITSYFNSRLIVELNPACSEKTIVARGKVGDFKLWLNS